MTIEVRQMVVRSTVTQRDERGRGEPVDEETLEERHEAMRARVLDECRRWIAETRDAPRER